MKIVFETEACTRCDGTGRYSFNMMHGTMCFKCKGSKSSLTGRGRAAKASFTTEIQARCTVQSWTLREGDKIWDDYRSIWLTVESVREENVSATEKMIVVTTSRGARRVELTHGFLKMNPKVRRDVMAYVAGEHRGATLVDD